VPTGFVLVGQKYNNNNNNPTLSDARFDRKRTIWPTHFLDDYTCIACARQNFR